MWPIFGVWGRRCHQSVYLESLEYQGLTQGRTVGVANMWGVGKEVSPVSLSRITGVPRIDTRKNCGCGQYLGCGEGGVTSLSRITGVPRIDTRKNCGCGQYLGCGEGGVTSQFIKNHWSTNN